VVGILHQDDPANREGSGSTSPDVFVITDDEVAPETGESGRPVVRGISGQPSRRRFTLRRLMAAVAASGLLLGLYRSLPSIAEFFNDDPYHAISTVRKSWVAGTSPSITLDVFEGMIQVLPSSDGMIRAELTSVAVTKISQSAANKAIGSIDWSDHQRNDYLRITAKGASRSGVQYQNHIKLEVPRGSPSICGPAWGQFTSAGIMPWAALPSLIGPSPPVQSGRGTIRIISWVTHRDT
jgi:hypothetical protein